MSEIERTSQNSARTTAVYDREPEKLLDAVERAVDSLPNWSLASRDGTGLRAVRATSLLRFKDDVEVKAQPGDSPSRTRIELTSASRLGKSDLGQNPRNLRELLAAVESELPEPG
jgi:uncharacterized protein (DUF1499 family)